jgi:hypothetical protein
MPKRPDQTYEQLVRRREQLQLELLEVESKLGETPEGAPPASPRPRPLRLMVLDALDDLGWPTYSRELMLYLKARYGRTVTPTRFGTLGSDEVKAFAKRGSGDENSATGDGVRRAGPRPVWLCFGLTYDRGEPIKRLWARSDWPLERRIVAPTSGRIQHLKVTKRLAELALEAGDTAADPMGMKIIAADHARDLPGVTFRRGDFPLETWRDTAARLLQEFEPRDEEARIEAARSIGRRSEHFQLFGRPDVVEVAETPLSTGRAGARS